MNYFFYFMFVYCGCMYVFLVVSSLPVPNAYSTFHAPNAKAGVDTPV